MGPLISAEQRDRVAGFVARARRQKHIEITTGGKAGSGGGFFYEPTVVAGARQYADKAQFIGVVYDDQEDKIVQFLAENGTSYPTLFDESGQTAIAFGVYGVPETFFIDANGKIVDKFVGPLDPATIEAKLRLAGAFR